MDFDPDKVSSEELLHIVKERGKIHSAAPDIAVMNAIEIIQSRIVESLSNLSDVTDELTKAAHRGERQHDLRVRLPIYYHCTYTLRQEIIPELKKYPDLFPDGHRFQLAWSVLDEFLWPEIKAVVKARYPNINHACSHDYGTNINSNEPSSLGDYSELDPRGMYNTIHISPRQRKARQLTLVIRFNW